MWENCHDYDPEIEKQLGLDRPESEVNGVPRRCAYHIEVDDPGCEKCGHGKTYIVVGPDGVGGSTSHFDIEDAEHEAEILNVAYGLGAQRAALTPEVPR